MKTTPTLMPTMSAAELLRATMTPAERSAGRFMRAEDHGAGTTADAGAAADAAAAAAQAGAGDAGKGAEGAAATGGDQVTNTGDEAQPAAGGAGDGGKGTGGDTSIAGGAGGDKEGGEGKPEPTDVLGAPEAYDVKVPEALAEKGMTFDSEVFGLVEPALRDLNLSNKAAQALTDVYAEKVVPALVKRGEEQAKAAQDTAAAALRKEWAEAARADEEIGGVNFDKTVDACAQVWDKFGIKPDTGIRQLLNESGLGNHPDMLRFLSRVAKVTGEGKFVPADGAGSDTRPIWDRVYGQPETASSGTGR